jgi:hypothetical protein
MHEAGHHLSICSAITVACIGGKPPARHKVPGLTVDEDTESLGGVLLHCQPPSISAIPVA